MLNIPISIEFASLPPIGELIGELAKNTTNNPQFASSSTPPYIKAAANYYWTRLRMSCFAVTKGELKSSSIGGTQ